MALAATPRERTRIYSFVAFVKDNDSKNEVEHLFKTDSLVDTHVATGDIQAAIEWLRKSDRSPQRILVDISGSSRPLDELDLLADVCEPSVQVYVAGDRNDVGLYRNLLTRGVTDYIVKPLNMDLMRRTFFTTQGGVRQTRHGKCVVFMGTRGGVGTTSIATHMGRALISGGAHRRVVYLDLNAYDGSGAGVLGHPGGTAFVDLLANTDRLDQQFIERALSQVEGGLYVLNAELDYGEAFSPHEGSLSLLLDALGRYFHYIIVDMPRKSGLLATEALEQAGIVCAVADNSVHSARTLTRMVRYAEARANPPVIIPILNHVRPLTANQVADKDFEKATDITIQLNIGFDNKGPVLAENLGQALPQSSDFNHHVGQLAKLVTGESGGSVLSPTRWWQRLLRR